MKNGLVFFIFFFILNFCFTQTKFSIIVGPHQAKINQTNNIPNWDTLKSKFSSLTTFHFGFGAEIELNKKNNLSFKPSIIYNLKGNNFFIKYDSLSSVTKDSSFKTNLNYIEIPLNIAFKIKLVGNLKMSISAGPYFGFFANGKEQSTVEYFDNNMLSSFYSSKNLSVGSKPGNYNNVDIGFNTAIGIEGNKLALTGNFSQSLNNIYIPKNYIGKFKNTTIGFTLSILLHKVENVQKEENIENEKIATIVKLPIDSDGDGVYDKDDKCPTIKGKLRYNGCPVPDTDNDGVDDEQDKCPTVFGLLQNKGCPPEEKKSNSLKSDTTYYTIYFEPNKFILKTEAYTILQNIVQQLKSNPSLHVLIKGFTDNIGNDAANYKLSLERANVAASYIASFYINKARLHTVAFGKKYPISDINDALLQWKNRRVELCVYTLK